MPVNQVLIEEPVSIDRELYLAVTLDRVLSMPVLLASRAGGMDIEEVAAARPEDIHSEAIDPLLGLMPFQTRTAGVETGVCGTVRPASGHDHGIHDPHQC